jgi:uridine kinase
MNYYWADNSVKVHNPSLPANFRMLIVGSSGSGKTTLLMRLLLEKGFINYEKLYVYAKSLYQAEYQVLIEGFKNNLNKKNMLLLLNAGEHIKTPSEWVIDYIKENKDNLDKFQFEYLSKNYKNIKSNNEWLEVKNKLEIDDDLDIPSIESLAIALAEEQRKPSKIDGEFSTNREEIIDPADLDKSIKNLIVFDDIQSEKNQDPASAYFTRGRSANCDAIYLAQNYTRLPLHTVRTNSNFMIFFKSSPLVIQQLFMNFASVDMVKSEFDNLCKIAWKNKFGYLVIDLSQDYSSGNKYRFKLELN